MPVKPSELRTQEGTLDLYYDNLLVPGVELKRRGKAVKQDRD